MSHHHTYYVTSSYILCHIIIHTVAKEVARPLLRESIAVSAGRCPVSVLYMYMSLLCPLYVPDMSRMCPLNVLTDLLVSCNARYMSFICPYTSFICPYMSFICPYMSFICPYMYSIPPLHVHNMSLICPHRFARLFQRESRP